MGRVTVRRPVLRIADDRSIRRPDALAAEEPLELRVDGASLAVTMRTPGHDVELAHGFLLTEGVIADREDVSTARYCDGRVDGSGSASLRVPTAGSGSASLRVPGDDDGRNTYNVLDLALAPGVAPPDASVERRFYTTSSCGVCGKASLDAVRTRTRFPLGAPGDDSTLPTEMLFGLPDALRAAQRVFDSTGGLHGAGLFDADGTLLVAREDVGRHNAVDKVIGHALLDGRIPASGTVLMVSGRASFELTQKAVMAGIPTLAAVSAPSSLAVEMAHDAGMTLIGFLRGRSMNVYAGAQRVDDTTTPRNTDTDSTEETISSRQSAQAGTTTGRTG